MVYQTPGAASRRALTRGRRCEGCATEHTLNVSPTALSDKATAPAGALRRCARTSASLAADKRSGAFAVCRCEPPRHAAYAYARARATRQRGTPRAPSEHVDGDGVCRVARGVGVRRARRRRASRKRARQVRRLAGHAQHGPLARASRAETVGACLHGSVHTCLARADAPPRRLAGNALALTAQPLGYG